MMAHTPGPWKVRPGVCRRDHPDTSADVHGPNGQFVAECGCHDQATPNATLIAAAPEMLEALKQLKSRVEELSAVRREGITGAAYDVMTASIGDDITAEFIEAEEAIAKAEGR